MTAVDQILDRERLTVREAAKRSSYSVAILYRAFERGEIKGERTGRAVRLYRDSLEDWLTRHSR
jgi:excisionase family DNA binding protein